MVRNAWNGQDRLKWVCMIGEQLTQALGTLNTGDTEYATLKGKSKVAANQAPKMSIPDRETSIAAFQGLRA